MKKRLSALDGLRGFAALAVFLSHSNFPISDMLKNPFLISIYKTLAVGPNSVQILFVLSGFLMAFLYSSIGNAIGFIQKRYGRIMPIYTLIVVFIWYSWNKSHYQYVSPVENIITLLGLAMIVYISWQIISRLLNRFSPAKIIFYVFISLQFILLLFNLFITPRYLDSNHNLFNASQSGILTLLSNLTMTTQFAKGILGMSGVFWSLAPEIIFYLLYPFIVIPLIKIGKKYGPIVSIIIIVSTIKILFDLDRVFIPLANLQSLNIARSSGFIVGVVVGTIYQSRLSLWQSCQKYFAKPTISLLTLFAFIGIQWGDWAIRDGKSLDFMNFYYLISSIVIGLIIISAIIPNTPVNRFFSNKLLVFIGMISYSMYLIHSETINWGNLIIPKGSQDSLLMKFSQIIITSLITVGVSFVLYKLVEDLYFQSKKKTKTAINPIKTEKPKMKTGLINQWRWLIVPLLTIGFFFIVYTGGYSPSFLISRHLFPQTNLFKQQEITLLKNKISIPIKSAYPNLSMITIDMRYEKNAGFTSKKIAKPAKLIFRLYDNDNKRLIFQSERDAFQIEGIPRFPFGIPTISQSANKKYLLELELLNGSAIDQIFVNTDTSSLVSVYTNPKRELLTNPFKFINNRFIFAFFNPTAVFALIFIFFASILYLRLSFNR